MHIESTSSLQLRRMSHPATYGVGGNNVYDETYRKAGKLDKTDFALGFDVNRSDSIDVVRTELFVESRDKPVAKDIRVDLYKLNVYGQNAFFTPHVDTPRSELMFGSLVIIFPTPYKGGELMLRRPGRKEVQHWELDSSALLEEETQPSSATSSTKSCPSPPGTVCQSVTYNLFHAGGKDSPSSHAIARSMPTNESTFQHTLSSVLDDPMFLPDGGNLMSGLAHTYPLAKSYPDVEAAKQALKNVEPHLKASDGVILRVLRKLSLDASLKIVYEARDSQFAGEMCYVMFDRVIKLPDNDHMIEGTASEYLEEEEGGQPVMAAGIRDHQIVRLAERMDKAKPIAVHWVTGNPKVEQEAEWVRREDPDVRQRSDHRGCVLADLDLRSCRSQGTMRGCEQRVR